jgi:hypothetical protein
MLTKQGQLGDIIIDDTGISKIYSRLIKAISDFFKTVLKHIAGNMHKTKAKILEKFLEEVNKYTKYENLFVDRHFSTIEIIGLLIKKQINFVFKIAKNKRVTTQQDF